MNSLPIHTNFCSHFVNIFGVLTRDNILCCSAPNLRWNIYLGWRIGHYGWDNVSNGGWIKFIIKKITSHWKGSLIINIFKELELTIQ